MAASEPVIQQVFVGTIDGVELVGFAERADGSGLSLVFQRAVTSDEQDRALGQDTYCLSLDSGATFYGVLDDWRISGDDLTLWLSPEAAGSAGVEVPVTLRLADPTTSSSAVEAAMRSMVHPAE